MISVFVAHQWCVAKVQVVDKQEKSKKPVDFPPSRIYIGSFHLAPRVHLPPSQD